MTLADFQKKWNRGNKQSVVLDANDELLNPDPIPTGIIALDEILNGGIPRGRIVQFIGEPGAGKTLLSQVIIKSVQQAGGTTLFVDVEHAYDPKWFALTGIDVNDPDTLMIIRPISLEQTFDMIDDALTSIQPDLIVLDSVGAMVPQDMMKAEMTKQDFRGLGARKITEGIKKIVASNQKTAIIVINQLRMQLGVTYGNPETLPGGYALRHASSAVIRARRGKWLTDAHALDSDDADAARIGYELRVRVERSKITAPFQEIKVKVYFTGEVDPISSLVHLAIQRGVIEHSGGAWYMVTGVDKKLNGLAQVEAQLKDDDDLLEKVTQQTRNAR